MLECQVPRMEKCLNLSLCSVIGSPLALVSHLPTSDSVSQPMKWNSQHSFHLRGVCVGGLSPLGPGPGLAWRAVVSEARLPCLVVGLQMREPHSQA